MNAQTKLDSYLNAVIEAGWLAALVLAPMFFNVFSSRVFEPDKISLIRTIALVSLLAWLVKLANGGRPWLPAYARGNGAGASPPSKQSDPDETAEESEEDDIPSRLSVLWRIPIILPIALLVIAYIISTYFSVAPFVSWWGSYQRLQGTYTVFSYIIIALLTMGHLRSPQQVRRLQHAIVLTSLPIAIYGIIQHNELDPLPWGGDVTSRVAANAGNAIFLAAYLLMALFFTIERVYSSFAYLLGNKPEEQADHQDVAAAFAGGAYLFILIVQLITIFWTQSRGPWIGLMLGMYLFVLLLFSALRPKYHRLWTGIWVGLGALGVVLLVAMNVTPYFEGLRSVPYIGRMTTLLQSEGGTGRVRILIWQGAAEMIQPHEALIFPDETRDGANIIRPLVGYGPEAMWIAFNPFYPPELAHVESRNASPDRSHNETWDSLVITGILGFLAYILLFITIFYWACKWLGLIINRRDNFLFGGLLLISALVSVALFYAYDDGWNYFGVALPAGLMLGLGIYVTLAAFIHPNLKPDRAELPRQLLLITLLATIASHFVEIHFGIAIAATRTYFWVETALLLVLGMRWAVAENYAAQVETSSSESESRPQTSGSGRDRRRGRGQGRANWGLPRSLSGGLPSVPATVMIDLLIFLTFVFIYTTNSQGSNNAFAILFDSITLNKNGAISPAMIYMLIFTWGVAAMIGMAAEALQQRRAPTSGWWLRGFGLHYLIVWGGWLVYGLIQGGRVTPGAAGNTLDSQLGVVAGHFAFFTWLLIGWILVAGAVLSWRWLRERRLPVANRLALSLGVGVVLTFLIFAIINSVNIALVRADIIYKQGQQFDSQGNWISSIELYRRALDARRTEDHYMLFLGRSLLEQAKAAPAEGAVPLPEDATLKDVLALTPEAVSQMARDDLLHSAEIVLQQAQRVNPLNTDHTANLARLYRTWADLTETPEVRQEMLDKSLAAYDMAVQLSPNAAHLWNEKGNAHLAREERDLAEQAYRHSLSLDERYDQTYLLLADFYQREDDYETSSEILQQAIEKIPNNPRIYSFLGVALARTGDQQGAIDANKEVISLQPENVGAMRNLALLYRDMGDLDQAIQWAEQAIAITNPNDVGEMRTMRQLAAQLYQAKGDGDQVVVQYEQLRQLDPNDTTTLTMLYSLYSEQEKWNQAVEVLQALTALEPDNYLHPLALAQILQRVGQRENAMNFANQALALAPDEQKAAINDLIALISES